MIGDNWFTDEELLIMLKEAIQNEDTSQFPTYGSLILNLLECLRTNKVDQNSIAYKIHASFFRKLLVLSNRMRYTDDEYIFWNFFRLLCRESPIRILAGIGYHGASLKGEMGSQNPDGLKIHLAIPSLVERKKHPSSMNHFKVKPGFIEESFEILKENKILVVNLCFDEKSLSQGTQLIKNTDKQSGLLSFSSLGDADYFFSPINKQKKTY